jgi:hypothetical protein
MATKDPGIQPPACLRIAGAALALWFIGGTMLDYLTPQGSVSRVDFAIGGLGRHLGVGLVLRQIWAWFPSLGVAAVGLLVGVMIFVQGPDITQPGATRLRCS